MKFHEYANLFPLMEGEELDRLAEDIKDNGQLEPIWTYEDKILDGRNRFKACAQVGVTPEFRVYKGAEPILFVVSMNLIRRHLTATQRAVVGYDILAPLETEAKKRQLRKPADSVQEKIPEQTGVQARGVAAEIVGVNEHYISDVKRIAQTPQGAEIIEEMRSGELDMLGAKAKATFKRPKPKSVTTEPAELAIFGATRGIISRWDTLLVSLTSEISDEGKRAPTIKFCKQTIELFQALVSRLQKVIKGLEDG